MWRFLENWLNSANVGSAAKGKLDEKRYRGVEELFTGLAGYNVLSSVLYDKPNIASRRDTHQKSVYKEAAILIRSECAKAQQPDIAISNDYIRRIEIDARVLRPGFMIGVWADAPDSNHKTRTTLVSKSHALASYDGTTSYPKVEASKLTLF